MLVIPPGWKIISKSKNPYDRVQVKCKDSKGRSQYIYHPLWPVLTGMLKFKRLCLFTRAIRKLGKCCDNDTDKLIKLMITTNIRVGSDKYAEDNETFGVCTLENTHVKKGVKDGDVVLCFCGKSGHRHEVNIHGENASFMKLKAREARNSGQKRLFPVGMADRLRYRFKQLVGEDFNPKDIRTYSANVALIKNLRKEPGKNTKKELSAAIRRTSETMHHTPSVCKTNYICPQIMEFWLDHPEKIKEPRCNLHKLIKLLKI